MINAVVIITVLTAVILQVKISRRHKIFTAHIIPAISFLFSIGFCIWFAFYGFADEGHTVDLTDGSTHHFQTVEEADAFITSVDKHSIQDVYHVRRVPGSIASGIVRLFFALNIFTLFLILIFWSRYWGYKRNQRINRDLN